MHAVDHAGEVAGIGAEADARIARSARRQPLREVHRHAVGLAELLAQDVAQRDLEHVGRAEHPLLLVRIGRRIGVEAQDRLGPRLAAAVTVARSVAAGKWRPTSAVAEAVAVPARRQRANVAREHRHDLVDLEGADHEEA